MSLPNQAGHEARPHRLSPGMCSKKSTPRPEGHLQALRASSSPKSQVLQARVHPTSPYSLNKIHLLHRLCMWRWDDPRGPDVPSWHLFHTVPLDNSLENSKGACCKTSPTTTSMTHWCSSTRESHISLAFKEKASTALLRQHPDFRRCLRSLVRNKPKQASS